MFIFGVICLALVGIRSGAYGANYEEDQTYILLSQKDAVTLRHSPSWGVEGHIEWLHLQPLALDYDNTTACNDVATCSDPIKYNRANLDVEGDSLSADILGAYLQQEGTYLFQSRDNNGVVLHRIAVRRNDSYVGRVTELLGVPFVYFPIREGRLGHQTDRGLGADCVATLIYGLRRSGKHLPYVSPARLYDYAVQVGESSELEKIEIREADILHFGFQTAVISEDTPPLGVLNASDKIIHSFHQYVEEVEFAHLTYRNMPFEILRWNL